VTKMNYVLNHARDLTARSAEEEFRRTNRKPKKPHSKGAWPAKYGGVCATCKTSFPAITLIRRNRLGKVVHAHGCPKKVRAPRE
jgi:bisphosphoglycerate-independent phosphoglycerate mutase (AlkP superfamily)